MDLDDGSYLQISWIFYCFINFLPFRNVRDLPSFLVFFSPKSIGASIVLITNMHSSMANLRHGQSSKHK